ncbi:hypothetical protein T10_11260 [Trichinella papuae]|uniref:Uncharacterized protein n=1 Tax=Trichinella papuae TaxID=268474 RepID=A0A0V1MUT1_9BILA|nr:hypothetical protein T10_11260 [Trichinella papuae]
MFMCQTHNRLKIKKCKILVFHLYEREMTPANPARLNISLRLLMKVDPYATAAINNCQNVEG